MAKPTQTELDAKAEAARVKDADAKEAERRATDPVATPLRPDAKVWEKDLWSANVRFTLAKKEADGSASAEKRYQKAKRELWDARQAWRKKEHPGRKTKDNDVTAAPETLGVAANPGE